MSAIRASLKLLDSGPDRITFPVYAALWRAPLGGVTFAPFLVGTTGSGKSVLAGLAQQYFGPGMDYQNLPGAWSSTANSLEATAFLAKDVLFVVDDWVPRGSVADVQRANRDADRLLRAQGNHSGRARCDRDGNPKAGKPPRGLILSTGEGLPDGQSLNARLLAINVQPDELLGPANAPKVTACQRDAGAGLYAAAMAGYVSWLAEDFDGRRELFRRGVEEQRSGLQGRASHLRTATAVAELLAAMDVFLEFAQERGAVTEDEADALWSRLTAALDEVTADQNREHTTGDPVEYFLSLLRSAVLVGESHLADKGGPPAEEPARWGWREDSAFVPKPAPPATEGVQGEQPQQDTNDGEWKKRHAPNGKQIGWVSGSYVYGAISKKLVKTLRKDPDLERLQEEEQQSLQEVKAADASVKSKLDQLIDGFHAAAAASGPGGGGAGPNSADGPLFGTNVVNGDVVVIGDAGTGRAAELPVLVADRLHPAHPGRHGDRVRGVGTGRRVGERAGLHRAARTGGPGPGPYPHAGC